MLQLGMRGQMKMKHTLYSCHQQVVSDTSMRSSELHEMRSRTSTQPAAYNNHKEEAVYVCLGIFLNLSVLVESCSS